MNFGIIGYGTIGRSGAVGEIEGMTLAYPGRYSEVSIFGQLGSAGVRNDAVKHGRPPLVTGLEGAKSVKISMGIYESSRKNAWVSID